MSFAQPFPDYEILDRVGAGAMGTVFKARHKRLNRIVALKVLKPSLARDSRYVDRLRREARIVASLSHPFIVTGYDLGEAGGYHYFVMEFVEGKSLRALLVEWGMFAEEYVRTVAAQVAQALDHAYQRGVIHRDIKPGNILIDEAGNVKLTDMGLAKGPADLTLTRDGATVGTPMYISPEQARNPHDVDVRTDLYSLGATLYHMATGLPPFRGDTMAQLITNVLNQPPQDPREVNPALSEGMALVIRKLLAKDLTVRYQTPRELLDDLDRIQRSLPPAIDATRLADEREPVRWWSRLLVAVSLVVVASFAWWVGLQMRDPVTGSTAAEFMQVLDEELRQLPTPGERLSRLAAVGERPPGAEGELQQRRRVAVEQLQRAVDQVVTEQLGDGFGALLAWLRDPAIWPDRARVERERLQPRLVAVAGVDSRQLPVNVRLARLDEFHRATERAIAERDGELLARCEQFLATTVPARVDSCLRAGDFAGADRTWRDALSTFGDGVRQPSVERLPESTRRVLRERHLVAQQAAQLELDQAETAVVGALRSEVDAVIALWQEQLADGVDPELVAAALPRFRRELVDVWPAAGQFRAGRNPWPDLDRAFGLMQNQVVLAVARREAARCAQRCDLAWRTVVHGTATDAVAVLPADEFPAEALTGRVAAHREALAALAAVEAVVLQAIGRASPPPIALLRTGEAEAVELRVEVADGKARLYGAPIGQPPRELQLSQLRFSDLLARLRTVGDPLAGLAAALRPLGVTVARLVGDELGDLGPVLAELSQPQRRFVLDEVWPRILRVREERPELPLDRDSVLARLRQARELALRTDTLGPLENALAVANSRLPESMRTSAEASELRGIEAWLRLARRRRDLAEELARLAPREAEIDVRIDGEELVAVVAFGPTALHRGAAEGWQLRTHGVEFAGGARPWANLASAMLQASPGLPPRGHRLRVSADVVWPAATVGSRLYAFEVRGVGGLLVIGADDTVHVALVDGDVRRQDQAQRAFQRAMAGFSSPSRPVVVAGAVHRLTFDVVTTAGRKRAMVQVGFEGVDLIPPEGREIEGQRAPAFVWLPQQEVALQRLVFEARGL